MPKAVVISTSKKFNLKSVEGGIVEIKRLTSEQWLSQREELSTVKVEADTKESDNPDIELQSFRRSTVYRNFATRIIDHNLTDENDAKLDFTIEENVNKLDPSILEEIVELFDSAQKNDEKKLGK
jgi:hypothetical protein